MEVRYAPVYEVSKLMNDKKSPKFSLQLKGTVTLLKETHQCDANKNSLKLSESGKKPEKICGPGKATKKWHYIKEITFETDNSDPQNSEIFFFLF
jgi:hypothetical protein